jgi:hypothetical protein
VISLAPRANIEERQKIARKLFIWGALVMEGQESILSNGLRHKSSYIQVLGDRGFPVTLFYLYKPMLINDCKGNAQV